MPTSPGIHRFVFSRVWRGEGAQHILPGTSTREEQAVGAKPLKSGAIERQSLALRIWRVRTAAVGAFLPANAKPAQILEHRADKLGATTGTVEIVVTKDELPLLRSGPLMRGPKSTRVPEVQVTRRRWREAAAIWTHIAHRTSSGYCASASAMPGKRKESNRCTFAQFSELSAGRGGPW